MGEWEWREGNWEPVFSLVEDYFVGRTLSMVAYFCHQNFAFLGVILQKQSS